MAPRNAKTKKSADVKSVENDVPKKARGKAKLSDDAITDILESELNEKVVTKRGKKTEPNGQAELNVMLEEQIPAKKGRNKAEKPLVVEKHNSEEETDELNSEENGKDRSSKDTEDSQPAGRRGRKKNEGTDKKNAKVDKNKLTKNEIEIEDKPKGRVRKAQPTVDKGAGDIEDQHNIKPESRGKGRKKADGKAIKEILPQEEQIIMDVEEDPHPISNEEIAEEITQAKIKGKKGKQAPTPKDKQTIEQPASKKRKLTKKEQGKGDGKDEAEEEIIEAPTAKGKRRQNKAAEPEKEPKSDGKDEAEEEIIEAPAGKGKRGQKKAAELEKEPASESQPKRGRKPANKGDEKVVEEEPKPKGRRGQKKEAQDEETQEGEANSRRRKADEKAPGEAKKKATLKNKSLTEYESLDFSNSSKTTQGKDWNFKIACWNVDGIRAWCTKGGLEYLQYEKPDILCLQEIKCSQEKFPNEIVNVPGYHAYWLSGDKDGYAGVGIYTKKIAIHVQYGLNNKELDDEGRIITAEYEQFYLVCTYVPNAGRKLITLPKRLKWNEEFRLHIKELDKKKPVIICGDMNVAHNEIDLANPKTNRKNAGFTDEERAGMTELLSEGFVDTYRHLHPDETGAYTFWTYMMNSRAKNVGWRLDYFIMSERLLPALCDSVIRSGVYGSDHCPITLYLHLTTADKPKE